MKRRENGFTIVELSLVLAITGLVAALVLTNISSGLNQQRYTDAVNQTTDFFRGQYTQTINTQNDRSTPEGCSGAVGASDCLLLGRIVRIAGDVATVYPVIAHRDISDDLGVDALTDTQILGSSQLQPGSIPLDTYTVDWGAQLVLPDSSDTFTMMVVRTPVSGAIRTYTSLSDTTTISQLLDPSVSPQSDRKLCVDAAGFNVGTQSMGINITKDAANTTGVQIIPAGGGC